MRHDPIEEVNDEVFFKEVMILEGNERVEVNNLNA